MSFTDLCVGVCSDQPDCEAEPAGCARGGAVLIRQPKGKQQKTLQKEKENKFQINENGWKG